MRRLTLRDLLPIEAVRRISPMTLASQNYTRWLRMARRHVLTADEAADLLQDALLAAIEAGRQPLLKPGDGAWFHGVLRRQAALRVRGAVRRRQRERSNPVQAGPDTQQGVASAGHAIDLDASELEPGTQRAVRVELGALPPALRSVMTLVLHGLDRAEIRQVLDLPDTALRQRLTALRRKMAGSPLESLRESFQLWLAARNGADAGLQRAALARGPARIPGFRMGVRDPDGHLLGIHVRRRSGQ